MGNRSRSRNRWLFEKENYERLEFLGDAVIDIIISRELMREFPEGDEGILTQKRSALVQTSFLSSMGQLLSLLDFIKIESIKISRQPRIFFFNYGWMTSSPFDFAFSWLRSSARLFNCCNKILNIKECTFQVLCLNL